MAGVQLQLNHTSSVNLTLSIGTVSTTVEVTEAAAMLDTSTAQLQSTYDSRAAVDVPGAGISKIVNGAGIYNLSLLGAGVASSGGVGQGTGPSVAGQRPENNTFNIDGVMNDNHYQTGPQVYVSNEAVSQFNVVQNQFSAEFGGASGGVFNAIVKTGTNQIHGSLFEYLQNRNLNAVDQTEVQQGIRSNPRFDNNRLGATIGGPIRKDKLFYFGNFEYNPLGQAAQPGQTVFSPTSAGLSALSNVSGVSKTNLGVFQQYVPVAATATDTVTVGGQSIPIGPLSFASPAYNNSYNAVAAIDWNVSTKDQVRGRYFYNRSVGLDFLAALPVFFAPSPNVNNSLSISEFHNFSATHGERTARVLQPQQPEHRRRQLQVPRPGRVSEYQYRRPAVADRAGPEYAQRLHREPVAVAGEPDQDLGQAHAQGRVQYVRHHSQRILRAARARRLRLRQLRGVPAGQAAHRRLAQRRAGRTQRRARPMAFLSATCRLPRM